ncbi:MAG: hypothetical protein WBV82_00295 [Myxococcaceae bacterium]
MKIRSASELKMLAVAVALFAGTSAYAQENLGTEAQVRCATRVSIALLGESPSTNLLGAAQPQAQVEAMLQSPEFVERFARFANQQFNDDPGATGEEDASYFMVKEVLTRKLPWKETFIGKWRVQGGSNGTARVVSDPEGLGYFRSPAWLKRYAGNELEGYKLRTAYRIMHNAIGLKLVASTNEPDVDTSATGREAAACRTCHYEGPFPLDKVARVLTRVERTGDEITFVPSTEAPQDILGGLIIHDDAQLVNALVNSEDFRFNACRLAFKFVYGRPEYSCEGAVFDRCMDAFSMYGTIQSAIQTVATDASFCQ